MPEKKAKKPAAKKENPAKKPGGEEEEQKTSADDLTKAESTVPAATTEPAVSDTALPEADTPLKVSSSTETPTPEPEPDEPKTSVSQVQSSSVAEVEEPQKNEEKEEKEEETEKPAEEEDVFAEEPKGSGKKLFLIFLIALVFGALIVGGYFYFMSQKPAEETKEADPTPTQKAETEEEEATNEAEMKDKDESDEESDEDEDTTEVSSLTVQILNGSGTAGEAGAVQDLLVETGLEDFDTGNASSFDYEETEVRMKETVPTSVFEDISEALDGYTVVEGDMLEDDADYDIVIIVGQKS